MKHVRKGAPFLFPLFVLLAAFYFLTPISSEPSSVTDIDALAPVEIFAEGFQEPTGVVVDTSGAVFVSDRKSGDVFKITQTEVHPVITDLKRPVGLAFDFQGRLLVVEEKTGRLLRLETDGSFTVLAQGMKQPRWVAVAEDGTIYLTAKGLRSAKDKDEEKDNEEESEVILRLTPHASLLTVFADGFKGLQGIAVHQNSLFAAAKGLKKGQEDRGAIFQIPIEPDSSAGPIAKLTKDEIKKPFGLLLDILGSLYVSAEELELATEAEDAIGKVAPDGTLTRFGSKLEKPRGLAFDGFGNLYVADGEGGDDGRIIRLRAPPPPVVKLPSFTNQSPLLVSGTTEKNSRIDAFLNDSTLPITVSTPDGSFSLTLNLKTNNQNLTTVFTTAHSGQGLTSAPAEFTIIHDNIAPLIANLQPANGSFLNNPRPLIHADFSDNLSGVEASKVEIRLDGFPVTAQASVTPSGFTLDPLNPSPLQPLFPLSEGVHTVSVSIADRAGNPASASTIFTIDVTPPTITNLTPAHGSVVATARPLIRADFSDNLSGINLASVRIFLDGANVTSLATISSSGFTLDPLNPLTLQPFNLSQGQHTVSVSVSDRAGNSAAASSSFTVSLGPQLNPIGNKTVNLGETLTFTVSATNPGGGGVTLFVSPLPLPNHATFNAATGLFTFTPDTTQVGSFQLTFSAVSGAQSSSETITITVPSPPPGGVTGVRGRVYNLNNTPLGNVKVTLKSSGHTAFSGPDGFFTLTGVPSGRQELIINGRQANLGVFAILAVPADLIEGVLNNLPSPITLPDVDVAAEVPVSQVFTTVVSNPSVPGVELTIPGGTAKNSDGTPFTGKLSINPVPDYGRPESRPEELRPGMAITIQPAGVRFNPPARLTFPNADGMPPGKELNLWSLSPDTGTFNLVGKMVVSADGRKIITVEGGVTASAWHFPLATSSTPADSSTGSTFCEACRARRGSEADIEEGSLYLSHTLSSYRSLGQSRSLSLTYSSLTADPRPIISLNTTLSVRAAVPNTFSTKLEVGGVQQGGEIFTDTRSLPEDRDSTSRISVQFDASNLSTGRYPYKATIFSNYLNSSIGGITNGNVIVLNRKKSPFGSGWALTDLQQLHVQTDGSALLTSGDGTALFFSGGPSTFTSPPGEFSILIRNANGTYTRTLKDGTRINFNAQGFQTSIEDRNGNRTSYTYDGTGRLLTITDPAGLVTTFTYSGEKLQKITDPAGRETLFQLDAQGNLIGITNPDKTSVSYLYDGKGHVVQFTDERGSATTYAYDFAGRFSQSTKPGGETRSLTSSKLQGLANTAGGQGTPINPAPVVRSEAATSSLTDGKGNRTTFTLNALGQIASQIDALGNTTLIERDSNGNPTKITRPNGAVVTMAYDSRGNLLNSTDPVNGTTTFTYDPNFNQVKSIKDPKNQTTTINYDLKGNPIEIIDALGNRTQMTYEARGLLTSVTSAVGTPQANTTSFTYDARGNLLTTTDPRGSVTTLTYDSAGNVFRSTDGEGRVTEFTYDSFNRLVSVVDPSVNVTRYSYDAKGNLTQVIDAKAQRTTFTYDALDRLISATNPFGLVETFTYDANGNLVSTTNRNLQTISFSYDALNRLISKTRPPTSSEVGSQVTTFNYDFVGNLIAVVNPTISVFNQYDLANRLVFTNSSTETALSTAPTQINQDTLIDANSRQFEGRTIQVNGKTLTVDGSHTFANLILANGAVLTHTPTTATTVGKLDIKVTGTLSIDTTSRIDVTGRGFLGGGKPGNPFLQSFNNSGMTVGFQRGSTGQSGGSYGGLGGSSSGSSNPVYGDFRDPNDPGSGGAALFGTAGNGGGLIRIVAQTIQLDGVIKADGESPATYGGGSGGGIRVDVGTLRGTGTISANGGNGQRDNGGGGGGGRVAVYYQNATGFDLTKVAAFGGIGNAAPNGGAGTIYLQGPARENGELIADNNNVAAPTQSTPILSTPSGLMALTNLRVKRAARMRVDDQANLAGTLEVSSGGEIIPVKRMIVFTINVNNGAVITQMPTTATASFKVDLSANTLTVDATSKIDVTSRGFLGGGKPGNPFLQSFNNSGMTIGFQRGSTGQSGGGYGGLGGSSGGTSNPVYGNFRDPNDPGSGGAALFGDAGNGGGLIRIVAQTIQLDGVIKADGESPATYGGGSGGGIRVDVGTLRGTGTISANGGNGQRDNGGGGGGGRVAVYYQNATGFDLTKVAAFGGIGNAAPNGGAGTIYLQGPARESGELIADNNSVAAPALSTPISATPPGQLNLTHLRVRRGGHARIDSLTSLTGTLEVSSAGELDLVSQRLSASTIEITGNSLLTHLFTTATAFFKVDLSAGTLTVDATSKIDVTSRGFLGGGKPGNPFLQSFNNSGMTIGFQRGSTGRSGGSYGGLGGSSEGAANPIYGDFRDPNEPGSGGAAAFGDAGNGGGLIRIVAQALNLAGVIKADGESPTFYAGGSGGGIRIDIGTLRGSGSISANGGTGQRDNGGGGGGGRIAIYYQNATGFDFNRVTAFAGIGNAAPNGGAGTIYLQGPARENGELIADNNSVAAPALSTPISATPPGQLNLTHLRVRRGGHARIDSLTSLTGTLEVSSAGELDLVSQRLSASTIEITGNSLLTHLFATASAFFKVDISANTLTVDATSKIDVTSRGFLGGNQPGNPFGRDAMTLGFQRGSTGRSGGSYGGLGGSSEGFANPVYGDFRDPNEVGSGGASVASPGGNGGGLIRIVAQALNLAGVIKADGETPTFYGAGSGGGIRIDVGTLNGTGRITANAGNGQRDNGGGGGGGRIAIYFQSLIGFDLQTQVTAFGGTGTAAPNGQPGTVFTQQTLAMRSPIDDEAPVMTAEHEPRPTNHDAQRLASLAMPVVELKPKEGAPKIPDFRELIAEMRAEIPQAERPQRRVFSPSELNTQNSELKTEHTNLYLALVSSSSFGSSVLPNPKSKIENPKSQEDFDPIYTYDLNGNRISMIDPTGITSYSYDALNRLTSITNNKGLTTTFTYDALGRRTSMTHGNGVVTSYSYDAASQLTRLAHQLGVTTIDSFDYTYDRVGNRRTKADRNGSYNYTYDALNRLVQAVNPLPTNPLETYTYDPVGNRTNSNQNGSSIFNQANQLTEDANFTYQYDANGNLTRKTARVGGAFTSYGYDAENKLVRVVTPGKTVNYKYDGLGRRVEKEIIEVTTTVRRYIYDNEDILLELDGSNNITARYTHGPGIDEPLVMEKGGASFFYHADGLGSITEITNQTGTIVQSYAYSSFGKIESQLDLNFIQPYTFTSREFDPETDLYYYRGRTYDWRTGRFNQEDPIRFLGGVNFYAYAWNNPVNLTDPFGETVFCGSGFSSIFIPDSWYGMYNFSSACRKHDGCYSSCSKSKAACDDTFYKNMLNECSKLTGYWLTDCISTARTYHYAVKRFGSGPYAAAKKDCPCNQQTEY